MPRAALAAMFRRDGLFGRDSSLTLSEQAVLQSRLPFIKGLKALSVDARPSLRLAALAELADALVVRGNVEQAESQARSAGFSEAAISEVATVIENVCVVFGRAITALPVASKSVETVWPLAHAA